MKSLFAEIVMCILINNTTTSSFDITGINKAAFDESIIGVLYMFNKNVFDAWKIRSNLLHNQFVENLKCFIKTNF